MKIKKWNGKVRGMVINVENVIELKEYKDIKKSEIKSYSILDMIMNPQKRKEVYDYYDKHYKSTKEEDEIFKEWQNRRKRR